MIGFHKHTEPLRKAHAVKTMSSNVFLKGIGNV